MVKSISAGVHNLSSYQNSAGSNSGALRRVFNSGGLIIEIIAQPLAPKDMLNLASSSQYLKQAVFTTSRWKAIERVGQELEPAFIAAASMNGNIFTQQRQTPQARRTVFSDLLCFFKAAQPQKSEQLRVTQHKKDYGWKMPNRAACNLHHINQLTSYFIKNYGQGGALLMAYEQPTLKRAQELGISNLHSDIPWFHAVSVSWPDKFKTYFEKNVSTDVVKFFVDLLQGIQPVHFHYASGMAELDSLFQSQFAKTITQSLPSNILLTTPVLRHPAIIRSFLQAAGSDLNRFLQTSDNKTKQTILHKVAAENNALSFYQLCVYGADSDAVDENGFTPRRLAEFIPPKSTQLS